MLEIMTGKVKEDAIVSVPGSKSYTHRLLIASALAGGRCVIKNMLRSEDTLLTLKALEQMGIQMDHTGEDLVVQGRGGELGQSDEPIYLGNSGTSMRLLSGVAAIGKGRYVLTGTKRMCERPIQDLLDGLNQAGVKAQASNMNGCPPVEITGSSVSGGAVSLKCDISSQYLSSMLLIAPYTKKGFDITVTHGPVSKPYIDMTLDIMEKFCVKVERDGYTRFSVNKGQIYEPGSYSVEPDGSQASYFWAAAAITGSRVKVKGVSLGSRQGDVGFARILEKMGCRVEYDEDGICVSGGELRAVEVDMADMPDMVPSLAVVAAFAKGTTKISNVAHLREKESDRLGSVACELRRMGIKAEAYDSGLIVQGGNPRGGQIRTYDDHRMAMSFAVTGLVVPGIFIENEKCVGKSFPDFWEVFKGLYRS